MILREKIEPQRAISTPPYKNIKQYDLFDGTDNLIASLWQSNLGEWLWTERFYNCGGVHELDATTTDEAVKQFYDEVESWINGEIDYLCEIRAEMNEEVIREIRD